VERQAVLSGEWLPLLTDIADRAAGIALRLFRSRGLRVEEKPDLSPVTEADRAIEDMARRLVRERHPGLGVLGEEGGEEAGAADVRVVIDPIDATRHFVRGGALFAPPLPLEGRGGGGGGGLGGARPHEPGVPGGGGVARPGSGAGGPSRVGAWSAPTGLCTRRCSGFCADDEHTARVESALPCGVPSRSAGAERIALGVCVPSANPCSLLAGPPCWPRCARRFGCVTTVAGPRMPTSGGCAGSSDSAACGIRASWGRVTSPGSSRAWRWTGTSVRRRRIKPFPRSVLCTITCLGSRSAGSIRSCGPSGPRA